MVYGALCAFRSGLGGGRWVCLFVFGGGWVGEGRYVYQWSGLGREGDPGMHIKKSVSKHNFLDASVVH